ncbi:unnamed protein product [Cylindrotheca closterium]|uniref:Chromatin assembly factor 1 subunit A dimerization domain-containing protein n=1 Tax=Cylindrotheca closterium TaxID=2856 RepID=A0AAD2G9U5_9STRA|nr:unnamed protein product [Cylindrotheca closterium]
MPTLEVVQNVVDASLSDDDNTVDLNSEEVVDPASSSCTPTKVLEDTNAVDKLPESSNLVDTNNNETQGNNETPKQVTPTDASSEDGSKHSASKQKQQKKVNQMTLGNFFFGVTKSPTKPKSPIVTSAKSKSKSASTATKEPAPKKAQEAEGTMEGPIELNSSDDSSVSTKETLSPKKETKETSNDAAKKTTTETISEESTTRDVAENASKQPESSAAEPESSTAENKMIEETEQDPTKEENDVEVIEEEESSKKEAKVSPKRKRRKSTKAAAQSKAVEAPPPPEEQPPIELSEERQEALQKYKDMKSRFETKADELFQEVYNGLPEEQFEMPDPETKAVEDSIASDEFPDFVVANMILLIEGSTLPISKLTEQVSRMLSTCHSKDWDSEEVATKIKLLSQRKPYMEKSTKDKSTMDVFEDDSNTRIWRWEILIVDIFPSEVLSDVKKARSARKKIASHWAATSRLIQALSNVEMAISYPGKSPKYDKEVAKVSQCEEKVLKFEREAEKKRMAEQAKRRKQEEQEMKKREKELQKERKLQEAEKKKQEAEVKKLEAVKARDEAKRKREAEKVEKEEAKKAEEEKKVKNLTKQKSCLMSFFAGPPKKKSRKSSEGSSGDESRAKAAPASSKSNNTESGGFKVEEFRSMINGGYASSKRQSVAPTTNNRKRPTGKIGLTVYMTVQAEEGFGFDAQPFAEQRKVTVSNRYRFLSFHEDCRPAYHGTWTKSSNIVTGRTPFGKDTKYLDYDYDSEGEWEEGDDEIGEDIEDEEKSKGEEDDDEGDARIYDYEDGFCISDDRYLDSEDEVDDETRALHKKKLQKGENEAALGHSVCIVAPAIGGLPAVDVDNSKVVVEGYEVEEGVNQLSIHKGIELCSPNLCLDAFPPPLVDENQVEKSAPAKSSADSNAQKDEYTMDEMRILATYVHHCELNSKEKIIEDLRTNHPDVFTNRAKAMRKLDNIAVKQRFNHSTGVYWEVKRSVLQELDLKKVLSKKIKDEPPKKPEKASKGKSTSPKKETKSTSKKRTSSGEAANPKNSKQKKTAKDTEKSPKTPPKEKASPPKEDASTKASANVLSAFLIKKKPKSA